jgi:shikimate 5-dehydrogenase
MTDEVKSEKKEAFPFFEEKIPVCNGAEGLVSLLEEYPNFKVCLYLAQKDDKGWDESTSRVYMNKSIPGFLYIPVNIKGGDTKELRAVYDIARENPNIIGINHTMPHRSNPVLRELFYRSEEGVGNMAVLVRNGEGELFPYDINGQAFVDGYIYDNKFGTFARKTVVMVGVGGAGESIAIEIAKRKPGEIILIDQKDKHGFIHSLGEVHTRYYRTIDEFVTNGMVDGDLVVINASGADISDANPLQKIFVMREGIFVDIRAQLNLSTVETAIHDFHWQAATGFAMNSRNDYVLLNRLAKIMTVEAPEFTKFRDYVAEAS